MCVSPFRPEERNASVNWLEQVAGRHRERHRSFSTPEGCVAGPESSLFDGPDANGVDPFPLSGSTTTTANNSYSTGAKVNLHPKASPLLSDSARALSSSQLPGVTVPLPRLSKTAGYRGSMHVLDAPETVTPTGCHHHHYWHKLDCPHFPVHHQRLTQSPNGDTDGGGSMFLVSSLHLPTYPRLVCN